MGLRKKGHEVTRKFIFFGYMEKQDELIRGWLGWELWLLVFLCMSSLICVADTSNWAIVAWMLVYLMVTIGMAIISTCKTASFYRISKKSRDIVSKHKDATLKDIFNKSPQYLKLIIILDIFYPVLWIFSFIVKLLFAQNAKNMKEMIMITAD